MVWRIGAVAWEFSVAKSIHDREVGDRIRGAPKGIGWKSSGRALTKWRRNGARAQSYLAKDLQKARGPKTCDRVGYRHWLPLEYPAGHRKPNCRIAQMHDPHNTPNG